MAITVVGQTTINIDTVYQRVLNIANKEQRGYITPQEFNLFADQAQKEIFEQAGEEFNLASPKQLGLVLFDKLKLVEKPKKTKTGQYKTGEDSNLNV